MSTSFNAASLLPVEGPNVSAASANVNQRDPGRVAHAAKEFESVLLGQWLQSAEKSFATVPGGDEDESDPGAEQMQSFALQHLGTALAASGGIGLAKFVSKALTTAGAKEDAAKEASGSGSGSAEGTSVR